MSDRLRRAAAILRAAGKEYGEDGAARLAAALSYFTVFSLVPLLFLLVAIAGFVFADPAVVADLIDQAAEVAGEQVAEVLAGLLDSVSDQRGTALSIGLVLAAYSASGIFLQVQGVLSEIFHVPKEARRKGAVGWLIRRGIALASALVLAVMTLVPMVAVAALGWLTGLLPEALDRLRPVLNLAVPLLSVGVLMLVVGLTFKVLPRIPIPGRAVKVGGAFTAAAGLGAAYLVGVYLTKFGSTGTLGALGGLAILLFFFNLMWSVYLLGAEVTKVYADYLVHGDIRQPSVRHGVGDSPPAAALGRVRAAPGRAVTPFLLGLVVGWLGRRR